MIWVWIWKITLIVALILFTGVSIVVIIGGIKEIIALVKQDK
jgi:hypothetical protein